MIDILTVEDNERPRPVCPGMSSCWVIGGTEHEHRHVIVLRTCTLESVGRSGPPPVLQGPKRMVPEGGEIRKLIETNTILSPYKMIFCCFTITY